MHLMFAFLLLLIAATGSTLAFTARPSSSVRPSPSVLYYYNSGNSGTGHGKDHHLPEGWSASDRKYGYAAAGASAAGEAGSSFFYHQANQDQSVSIVGMGRGLNENWGGRQPTRPIVPAEAPIMDRAYRSPNKNLRRMILNNNNNDEESIDLLSR